MSKKNLTVRAAKNLTASLSSLSATAVLDSPAVEETLPTDTAAPETTVIEGISDTDAVALLAESSSSDSFAPVTPAVVGATPLVRDTLGYGTGTETSFILAAILAGNATKDAIRSAFLSKYAGEDAEEIKRKKTTFSVFFSDVKRPIGTYHASRGLVLVTSEDGIVSVTPESYATAKRVVDAGILSALRGITRKGKPKAYAKVLESFGLPVPSDKD